MFSNIKSFILYFLRGYKNFFSPFLSLAPLVFPVVCKFYPTCSEYSFEAINEYGICKGVWLSFKRILRCNPVNRGGYDPL